MLVRIREGSLSKRNQTSFGLIDKHMKRVFLKEGETLEVDDKEGRGYVANYPMIVEKIETDDKQQGIEINDLQRQVNELKAMIVSLNGKKTEEKAKEVESEKQEVEEKEKEEAKEEKTEAEEKTVEIETLRQKYTEKTGKSVPPRFRNDKERILQQLS